jgi:hypothetical protein
MEGVQAILKEACEKADRIWHLASDIYFMLKSPALELIERRGPEDEERFNFIFATLNKMFFDAAELRRCAKDIMEKLKEIKP